MEGANEMTHGPVHLRLCTNELKIVSEDWWYRFLESQTKTQKVSIDNRTGRTSISRRGSSTDVNMESREETGRREQRHTAG